MSQDDRPPIDGNALSAYITGGREHFERVERALAVFARNASELLGHLRSVETNPLASIVLMQDPRGSGDHAATHRAFWDELDQRLHNLLASAASLIDHTRPLVRFYEHEPDFQAEWETRNRAVAASPRASFIRTLRNYLVHKGPAPLMQTMRLGPPMAAEEWDHLRIQLAGAGLLQWSKWNAADGRSSRASRAARRLGRCRPDTPRTCTSSTRGCSSSSPSSTLPARSLGT